MQALAVAQSLDEEERQQEERAKEERSTKKSIRQPKERAKRNIAFENDDSQSNATDSSAPIAPPTIPDSVSERIKTVKEKKTVPGPRTRSRANTTDLGDKDPTHAIEKKGKKVAPARNSATLLKPTCSKLLNQGDKSVQSGTVAIYIALWESQRKDLEGDRRTCDVGETSLPNADEEVQLAPKKRRGRTKMLKVHGRSTDEKKAIKLSKRGQPIGDRKLTCELSNFLGTLVKDLVSLTYVNWHVVPKELKQKMMEYTLDRYIIPEEGEWWVNKTLSSLWRTHKSRLKESHYTQYHTDEERIQHRPETIPLEDFKMLLKYWADDEVKALAEDNKARHNSSAEPHTLGRNSLAQLRNKLEDIKEMLKDGKDADVLLPTKKNRPDWLVGRQGKTVASTETHVIPIPEHVVEQLTAKITQNLEREMEDKVNKKVQGNMACFLKKLGEARPDMKLDVAAFCATFSSVQDDPVTPVTPASQSGATS
ncbi:hypothetical protein POM88_020846 [Heracleum sosnowskyi]|uniref:Uncharacterized protein n=1 Tax=Heracleum sosnowskyi TaxID=360622 RepID=A0AAD8IDQ5_9APIA|nr:hypothetical protein POM88_020846 [Heracleum sosnowskyi]